MCRQNVLRRRLGFVGGQHKHLIVVKVKRQKLVLAGVNSVHQRTQVGHRIAIEAQDLHQGGHATRANQRCIMGTLRGLCVAINTTVRTWVLTRSSNLRSHVRRQCAG